MADLPFRARSIPSVYLAPGSEARIQAAPELLARYVLPQAIARRALNADSGAVYRFDGQMLHKVASQTGALWTETEPRFVNLGDPVFADYVGAGWQKPVNACRLLDHAGTLRIAAPRTADEALYVGVFETRDFRPRVRVNGVEVTVALRQRDNDLSEFRAVLPPEASRVDPPGSGDRKSADGAAPVRLRGGAVKRRDFPALTGLRFFLALWVILHHLTGPGQKLEATALLLPDGMFTLIRGGYQAVTTFFVLSGFVLTRSYATTAWSRRNTLRYALGRVARVYPVYLLSLAVVAPFILPDQTPGKPGYLVAHLLLVQAWLGAIPVNWNTPAWSLSCEMFFYAMFPLAARFIRSATWRSVAAAAAVAVCLTRVMWALGVSDNIKPLVHLSDFMMGIAAACAYELLQQRAQPPRGWWLYIPGFAGAATAIAYATFLPEFIDLNSVLRPLNGLLLIGLALGGGVPARWLSNRLVVYLGKSSYAMYILHVPILWWCLRRSPEFPPLAYIAIVIAISAAVYGLFEEPANRKLRSSLRDPARQPVPASP